MFALSTRIRDPRQPCRCVVAFLGPSRRATWLIHLSSSPLTAGALFPRPFITVLSQLFSIVSGVIFNEKILSSPRPSQFLFPPSSLHAQHSSLWPCLRLSLGTHLPLAPPPAASRPLTILSSATALALLFSPFVARAWFYESSAAFAGYHLFLG